MPCGFPRWANPTASPDQAGIRAALSEMRAVNDRRKIASLSQSKRLGSALDEVLKDHETAARAAQRNQATAEASRVGTKLLAILAGVYLPEFVLLIMIPLFLGIVQRAFG